MQNPNSSINKKLSKWLCFAVVTFLFVGCAQQGFISPDLEQMKLNSNVKSIEARTFKAIEVDGNVVKDEATPYGSAEYMNFDQEGRYTSIEYFTAQNQLESKQAFEHNDSKYVTKVIGTNADGISDGEYFIQYDAQDRITQRQLVAVDGTVQSVQKYAYSNSKNPDSIQIINQSGALEYTYAMTYHENEELATLKVLSTEQVILANYSYTYNKNNQIQEEIAYTKDGEIQNTETSEYQYDINNNWVQKVTRTNNELQYIVERVITYY